MRRRILAGLLVAAAGLFVSPANSRAEIISGPFQNDADTLLLLHFDEGSGVPSDSSAFNRRIEKSTATWTETGRFGTALEFDGSTGYVKVSESGLNPFPGAFTVEAWIRSEDNAGWTRGLIWGDSGFYLGTDTGNLVVFWVSGAGRASFPRISLTTGAWHHIAGTCDGKYVKLFLDGVLVDKVSVSAPPQPVSTKVVFIGRRADYDSKFFFRGAMDEVRISSSVRYDAGNAAEVHSRVFDVEPVREGIDDSGEKVRVESFFAGLPKGLQNLVANNSFELGFKGWERLNTGYDGENALTWELDESTSVHGRNSVKIIHDLPHLTSELCSAAILVDKNKKYVLSAYLKTDSPGISVFMGGKPLSLTTEWQRYSIEADLSSPPWLEGRDFKPSAYFVRLGIFGKGKVWLDAVQLEEGQLSDYRTTPLLEAGLGTDRRNNIYHAGQPVSLSAHFFNGAVQSTRADFTCCITDYYRQTVWKENLKVNLEANQGISSILSPPLGKKTGIFYAELIDNADRKIRDRISIAVIEPLSNRNISPEDNFFGYSGSGCPPNWEMLASLAEDLGMGWAVLYNMNDQGAFYSRWPSAPDQLRLDTLLKYGMTFVFMPKGSPTERDEKNTYYRNLSPDDWKKVVKTWVDIYTWAAQRYPHKVGYLNVAPEWIDKRPPRSEVYSRCMAEIYPAVKKIDPAVRIIGGGGMGSQEFYPALENLFSLGAYPYLDIVDIHPYTPPLHVAPEKSGFAEGLQQLRVLMDKYAEKFGRKEIWVTEQGFMGADVLHPDLPLPYAGTEGMMTVTERTQAEYIVRMNVLALALGVKKFCYYSLNGGRLGKPDPYGLTNGAGDSPKAGFVAYNTMVRMLRGAVPVKRIQIDKVLECCIFRKNGEYLAAVWNTDSAAGAVQMTISIRRIKLTDLMGNLQELCAEKGTLALDVTGSPLFIECGDMKEDDFVGIFQNCSVSLENPAKVEIKLNRNQKEISVFLKNISQKRIDNCRLEVNLPVEWKLSGPPGIALSLQPYEEKELRFSLSEMPFVPGRRYPVTARGVFNEKKLTFTREFGDLNGVETCYFLKKPPVIDGNLGEWRREPIVLGAKERRTLKGQSPGEEDINRARVYLGWDERYFYFAAEVEDDTFVPAPPGRNMWEGDSVQIAFDAMADATGPGYDGKNDYEYGLALTNSGVEIYRWHPENLQGTVSSVKSAVKNTGGKTCYEAAIPFSELHCFPPRPGGVMGFNVVFNDNDGRGFKGWLELTGGIVPGKNPASFKTLVFVE